MMQPDDFPPPTSGRRRHLGAYFFLGLTAFFLLVGTVIIVRQVAFSQEVDSRRITYAATATVLAHPTVSPVVTAVPPTSEPILLPTDEDLLILPTMTQPAPILADAPPAATFIPSEYDITNFLVLGIDSWEETRAYRTDVILIVSANRTTQTVSFLSIPRDLYVYIPGWGMDRVNAAEIHQLQLDPPAHPLGLLAETLEYNLGIPIHHIARIDFAGFRSLIDSLGGITVPVDCPVSGNRLASPDLDPNALANWTPFTLEPGMRHLDGSLALWYVRQRMDSSDFERNRRQQIVLRVLWHTLNGPDLVHNLPMLWDSFTSIVQTDLTLDQALGFVPMLLNLDPSRVEGHYLGLDEVNLWQTPDGASVLVIDPEPFARTMYRFITPPTDNQLTREQASVDVVNTSLMPDADQLAASRLQGMGFLAVARGGGPTGEFPRTAIYDHTGQGKGSSLTMLKTLLGVADSEVFIDFDPSYTVDFTVVIGENYVSCSTSPWRAFPQPE